MSEPSGSVRLVHVRKADLDGFPPEERWIGDGDTGTSSLTIWAVLMKRVSPDGNFYYPLDPDDFGRCYRLLKIMPEWRNRLGEVAEAYPPFAPFVREWDRISALYEHELEHGPVSKRGYRMAPQTYALMQELRKEVEPR